MANGRHGGEGPQRHAEGQHGEKTRRRFIEQLQETGPRAAKSGAQDAQENQRLEQDRDQHDEAEKGSEKVKAIRIPHEGDSR